MKPVKAKKFLSLLLSLIISLSLVPAYTVNADYAGKPFVHPLFSDHMVLQREVENVIWGWTSPGEIVTVEINGSTSSGVADSNGRWKATIKAFEKGGPYELKVTSSSGTATIKDIYFGELWLCSGQSNMAMQLPYVLNGDTEAANSNNPNIRFFTAPYNGTATASDTFGYGSSWNVCGPNTVGNLSGAAYFFARELNNELDVPIGIINSSVGGSFIESWISNGALSDFLASNPVNGYTAINPNIYYNGMISPFIPLKVKGVLWYQGESNTQYASLYEKQLGTLINDWRYGFGISKLPFIIIQLPNYLQTQTTPVEDLPWVTIREAQAAVAQSEENVGLVTTIDIGAADDIHPKNKQDVGKRAALCALGKFYGKSITYSGPTYNGMVKEGNKIRLNFKNTGSGLMAGSKSGLDPVQEVSALKGFAIAGADGNFVWADAVIEGNSVIVSSPSVPQPEAVRYAWAINPIGNLYNKEGLPASPFRTDGTFVVNPVIKGDVNDDAQVDVIDMVLVKKHILGIEELTGNALEAADVDSSGSVDAIDLSMIKKYLLGLITEF
jgi:sialate O-acetylesterase